MLRYIFLSLFALLLLTACGDGLTGRAGGELSTKQQEASEKPKHGANSTNRPYLTKKRVLGLINQYADEGKPGSQCIDYSGTSDDSKEVHYEAGYWEVIVSGARCDGVEAYQVHDSDNGTITRIRPTWIQHTHPWGNTDKRD